MTAFQAGDLGREQAKVKVWTGMVPGTSFTESGPRTAFRRERETGKDILMSYCLE